MTSSRMNSRFKILHYKEIHKEEEDGLCYFHGVVSFLNEHWISLLPDHLIMAFLNLGGIYCTS